MPDGGAAMKQTILIAEDEADIRNILRLYLESENYEVLEAADGESAVAAVRSGSPDLVILDIMMPKLDGFAVVRAIRQQSDIPVLILSARNQDNDKILGLNLGADDYIAKPFGVMEMIARVKALLRRSGGMEESLLTCGNVTLDGEKRMVYVDGKTIELTYKEFELLKLLMKNHGIVISRDVIMERVWDSSFEGESRTIDVHVRTLRQKLGDGGALIKTIRNVGYMVDTTK